MGGVPAAGGVGADGARADAWGDVELLPLRPHADERVVAEPGAATLQFDPQGDAEEPVAARSGLDAWPHTTRVLPWMLAGFIAMLWLIPFNTISLTVSLPFDLHLDRLVLPVVALVWVLSLFAGGTTAPRIRFTPIHVAIGIFVSVSILSLVFNISEVSQLLEVDSSVKHLVLLASYALLFVILASVVRVEEVAAFIKFTLGLAVVVSIGMLWEHRYGTDVFYLWSSKLLPGIFSVPPVDTSGVDEIGRRLTLGPGELGLETASMLSMALPIALVGVMSSRPRRSRILYGVAACLIVAASVSTYRKTAMVTPVIVIITLGVYRRRDLARLLPLAAALFVVVHILSPGALGGVFEQFSGSRLSSVSTVDHRAIAYDAVRPMVWTNLALGQGYGSYDAFVNRILDSQVLTAVIETGLIGLAAYLAMMLTVVGVATPMIRRRNQERGPPRGEPALIAACVAMAFLTVSFLYDSMNFPHAPYIFLTFAGFLAVLWRSPGERALEQEHGPELVA